MPRRNRVDPYGVLHAVAARGTMMGNRGVLHDADGRIGGRRWTTRAWLVCRLCFRGRRRAIMQPRRYTELFFLDEATALAAGHRPCAECRHGDFLRFAFAWAAAVEGRGDGRSFADAIDRRLHAERIGEAGVRPTWPVHPADLPDGAFVGTAGAPDAWLHWRGRLYGWRPEGYGEARALEAATGLRLLTPPSTCATLRAGYRPAVHPSAGQGAPAA